MKKNIQIKKVSYIELGATLFTPGSLFSLNSIVNNQKYPELKSIVIDFEDGLDDKLFESADEQFRKVIKGINEKSPFVFVRAKNTAHLRDILKYEGIENITGFVLAKFNLSNSDDYLELLKETKHSFMPSIEGKELFETNDLKILREKILKHKQRVVLIRFGLEDMLKQLGMKRSCDYSLFDYAVCSSIIGNFLAIFKSSGFAVSGGVYPCFKDKNGFIKDVKRDLREGLFSKTIIHPAQIALVHEQYKVTKEEYEEARRLLGTTKAVINLDGKMGEVNTMSPYAKEIMQRAEVYGVLE